MSNVLEAAVRWVELGLPVRRLEIVVRDEAAAQLAFEAFERREVVDLGEVAEELVFEDEADPAADTGTATEEIADVDTIIEDAGLSALLDAAHALGTSALRSFAYDVFVSYAHEDAQAADVLADALRARGARVFVDRSELEPGAIWQQKIFESLDDCETIVALLSPHYLASAFCIEEYHIAMIRRRNESSELLTPVYLATARLPTYMQLVQWIDCRESDEAKLRSAVERLRLEVGRPPDIAL